jgi:hexosaminidase
MWEEIADAENLDAKLWPRLAAIAERFWSPQSATDVQSMYARLAPTNEWLMWLGLRQRSNIELMRQRLAGANAPELDRFAAILEPVKGYGRHAEKYQTDTPLNRLVDSLPPESEAARQFRNEVDAYLSSPNDAQKTKLSEQLTDWYNTASNIHSTLEQNSLLTEDIPVAEAIMNLCQTGREALQAGSGDQQWKTSRASSVKDASAAHADILIQIAPAIAKLVDAINVSSAQ